MLNKQGTENLSEKMRLGFAKARKKFLEQEAKIDGVIIIADKNGKISKVPAKELLQETKKS